LDVQAHPVKNKGRQVAALCWRLAPTLEVLLVTSLRTRRWILPKGWPMRGMSSAQSAAHEALEEAGVAGEIATLPVGRYHYLKEKKGRSIPCNVDVFPLHVRHLLRTWPEKGTREIIWLPVSEAARRIVEPELRHILLTFHKGRVAA
jgi:8-oxo-dGTP pyrophosphatase MutT (NUDIX family)